MTTTQQLSHAEGVDRLYGMLRQHPDVLACFEPEGGDAAGWGSKATVKPDVFSVDRWGHSHCYDFKCSVADTQRQIGKVSVGDFQVVASERGVIQIEDLPMAWLGLIWLDEQEYEVIRDPRRAPSIDTAAERRLMACAYKAKAAELDRVLRGEEPRQGKTPGKRPVREAAYAPAVRDWLSGGPSSASAFKHLFAGLHADTALAVAKRIEKDIAAGRLPGVERVPHSTPALFKLSE